MGFGSEGWYSFTSFDKEHVEDSTDRAWLENMCWCLLGIHCLKICNKITDTTFGIGGIEYLTGSLWWWKSSGWTIWVQASNDMQQSFVLTTYWSPQKWFHPWMLCKASPAVFFGAEKNCTKSTLWGDERKDEAMKMAKSRTFSFRKTWQVGTSYIYNRCIKVPSRYTKCYDYSRAKLKNPNCQMFFFRDFGWSLDLEPGKPAWRCSREIHKFRWGDLRSWSRKGITNDLWVWNTALEDSQIRLPQKRDHFRRKGSSSNHRFSWDMFVFGGSMWNFAVWDVISRLRCA